jgi:outer membrane protein insertion porin family
MIVLVFIVSHTLAQDTDEAPEIVDIKITGNNYLGTSELLSQIHLKEKRLFSGGSFYNRHYLAREIEKLENYYTLHGFMDVSITDSTSVSVDNKMHLFLKVVEGKEYYLRDINLKGNRVFSDQKYLELIEYQAGSSFNTFKIRENLIEMLTLYRDNGYPLINIQDSVVIADSVSLFITVIEGPILNIGQININETEQVPDHIIRREIIVQSGELFNSSNIEESKRRLYETSLFNSVNIRMGRVDSSKATIDLDVEVSPAKFRAFDMTLGVKQEIQEGTDNQLESSIGATGSWYHNNLFDRSRRIRTQANISSIYPAILIPQQFKMDFFYVEPWLYKLRVPLTINPFLYYIDRTRDEFKSNAYGVRAILTYRWFRKLKIQSLTEWSFSRSEGTPTASEDVYESARKVGLKLIWDERDNFFYPKRGFKLVIEPGIVGYFLKGENNYMQMKTSFSSYWNIFSDVVFAHNVNVGFAIQKDPDIAIPYEKRFFLGGNSSIRGFEQQALGPTELLDGDPIPAGGNFRYFTNFEIRFPIYSYFGGEVFLDAGNIWSDIEDANTSEIIAAVGLGLTIETPIGPARIDYGIPVGSDAATNAGQTHIAIAYAF